MIKTLMKKQLMELFQSYLYDSKKKQNRSTAGLIMMVVLGVLVFGGCGVAFFLLAGGLCATCVEFDLLWLFFALMGMLAIALGVFGSVFNTYASLYLPKDNELLLSLPIPDSKLLLARLSGVYVTSLMYSAWIWIPSVIAYWMITDRLSVSVFLFPLIMTFFIALFVSVLTCLLGWVVALVSTKAKGKSYLTVFLSLSVLILYYVVYFKIVNSIEDIMASVDVIGEKVQKWLGLIYMMGRGSTGEFLPLLIFALVVLVLAAVCFAVMAKTFTRFTLAEAKTVKKELKEDSLSVSNTMGRALFNRELKHFTSEATWMLNGGLGLLLLPMVAIAAIFYREALMENIEVLSALAPSLAAGIPFVVFGLVGVFITTNCITPVAISIEGRSLWILQSLPIEMKDLLKAKEQMNFVLNVIPAVIGTVIFSVLLKFNVLTILLLLTAVVFYIAVTGAVGLLLNLLRPNLNWTNVATIAKQSLPVFVFLFGGWIISAGIGFGGFFLTKLVGIYFALLIVIAVLALLYALLDMWMKKTGAEIMRTL